MHKLTIEIYCARIFGTDRIYKYTDFKEKEGKYAYNTNAVQNIIFWRRY